MWKFVILLGLLPIVTSVFVRKWFGGRLLRGGEVLKVGSSASTLARRLVSGAALKLKVESAKHSRLTTEGLFLADKTANEKGVREVAEACTLAGLAMLSRRQARLPEWRERALKFAWAFPSFTLLVVVFALIVAKLPAVWALAIVILSNGLGCVAGLFTAWVDWQAAGMVSKLTEARAIFTREDDRQLVLKSMKALAAEKALPSFLAKIFGKGR